MGRSVAFGATLPGEGYAAGTVLLGEVITTFIMVTLLAVFLAFRRIRPFTPALFPPLYALMVYIESPISGTSTNPARSLGPAVISGQWDRWWIYWVGPVIGSVAACVVCSALAKRITVAKLYHFDSDRDRLFRGRVPETHEWVTMTCRWHLPGRIAVRRRTVFRCRAAHRVRGRSRR